MISKDKTTQVFRTNEASQPLGMATLKATWTCVLEDFSVGIPMVQDDAVVMCIIILIAIVPLLRAYAVA